MAATHTVSTNYNHGSDSITSTGTYTGTGVIEIVGETVGASSTVQFTCTIDVSAITNIVALSDSVVTIKTNSSGAPDDTIALKAGVPYIWNADAYFTNLFTTDVTTIYVQNATGSAASFDLRVLYDSTP